MFGPQTQSIERPAGPQQAPPRASFKRVSGSRVLLATIGRSLTERASGSSAGSPSVHLIQMGWATLVLKIVSNN